MFIAEPFNDAQFLEQHQRVVAAANQARAKELRALAAYYNDVNHLIVIRLNTEAVLSFAPDIAQGLAGASKADLSTIEITPSGTGLHWENLDADFSVLGLLRGCFGSKTGMATLQNRLQSQLA